MRVLRILLLIFFILILFACSNQHKQEISIENGEHNINKAEAPYNSNHFNEGEINRTIEPKLDIKLETTTLKLMAVGDIMMHMPQVYAGKIDSNYDFYPFFDQVAPIFKESDFVLGNLETTMAGADRGYSGYPQFNSPDALADALASAGFTVITTANNHSLDTGEKGLLRTLDQLERVGLQYTGTFRSLEEKEQILILEKNNITLAVLAYTYGTNGIPLPQGKDYLVNLINEEQMEKDIRKAKQLGVDLVVVSLHFGNEYQLEPNQLQRDLVDQLFEWGTDLILGSHPHVLQPLEQKKWFDDEGKEKEGVVIYSLGNFISNQRTEPRDIGGILSVRVSKTGEATTIEQVEFIPTYVHIYTSENRKNYKILPLTGDWQSISLLSEHLKSTLLNRYEETMNHVFPNIKK